MGSPRGAIFVTRTSVPGVSPMSTRRRFTLPDLLAMDRMVPLWPGARSYSMEEIVARDFIIGEGPDCVIDIVDATNLERNLYLTVQLLELERPTVVALEPSFFSTVTPGQLPTYWLEPVRALKRVVLPQLGLPARAIRMARLSCSAGS